MKEKVKFNNETIISIMFLFAAILVISKITIKNEQANETWINPENQVLLGYTIYNGRQAMILNLSNSIYICPLIKGRYNCYNITNIIQKK